MYGGVKDEKHAENIDRVGGVFIPLIFETQKGWIPYANMQALSRVAPTTTIHNDLTSADASGQLLQQLLLKLWLGNAKII